LALDTISSSTGGVIDRVKVENMPQTGRMVWDSVVFTQGVRSNSSQPFNITPRNNTSSRYVVAGTQQDEYAYFLNGAPVSDQGSWYFTPSAEAVDQLQAAVMPYDSQYGRSGGATFNSNIKSGTNKFHGGIWDYFGNGVLNANEWNKNLNHVAKQPNNRNTYGGQLGGPIFRGKTFFFANFEALRQRQTTTSVQTVPLPAWKNGDFSDGTYKIFDPASLKCTVTTSGACTAYARTQYLGNKIPDSAMNPIGKAIMAFYPDPNRDGTLNNYVATNPIEYQYDQYIGRVDHSFTENTRVYGLYVLQNNNTFTAGNAFPNESSTQATGPQSDWNIILGLTHILSPTTVVDAKASYGKYKSTSYNGVSIQDNFTADKLAGLKMPLVGTVGKSITPKFTFSGGGSGAQLFANTANGSENADTDISSSVSQELGRHSLHLGAEFMDIQTAPTGMLGNPYGTFNFDQSFTQSNPQAAKTGEGSAFADLLLGDPNAGSLDWNQPTFVVSHYWALYMHDDFKVRSNLTLNLGLRWDINTSPYDRHNRTNAGFCFTCTNPLAAKVNLSKVPSSVQVSPLVGGLQFPGIDGASDRPFNVSWKNWQPRVGFAWNVHSSTVIRGGYGLYYPWIALAVDTYGFSNTTTYSSVSDQPFMPSQAFASGNPYPNGVIAPSGASLGMATSVGNSISFNDSDRITRRTQHWSLGVQQKLPWDLLVDIQYLGSQVSHLPVTQSLGVISTAQQEYCLANGALCNNNVAGGNPLYGVVPATSTLATPQIAMWKLMRAYPMFDGVSEQRVPIGNSHFNSLDVRVERRVKSLNFVFGYAYSNWMTQNQYLNDGSFQDNTLWKGLDPSDVRNALKANVVYPLPQIHKEAVLDSIANGWQVVSTFIWQTGLPLSMPNGNFNWNAGRNCTSYEAPEGQTRLRWWNNHAECWTQLTAWQRRVTPLYIGSIRAQGRTLWNPAIQKNFTVWPEKVKGRFRMEAWNGANHPVFGMPGTNLGNLGIVRCTPDGSMNCNGPGTLPVSQENIPRNIIASLKLSF